MTPAPLRIALAQINAVVGDIAGNEARIADGIAAARDAGAQLVCFPELALTGYPPEDLLLKEHFLADARQALDRLADLARGIVAIVGYPERAEDVHNAAAVLADGALRASYRKLHLPNYGVFDEFRHFVPGHETQVIQVGGIDIALAICEDIWQDGPSEAARAAEAGLLLVINGSPYEAAKDDVRLQLCARRAREGGCALAYVNLVGGQDELVFEGDSVVVGPDGDRVALQDQLVLAADEVDVCESTAALPCATGAEL